MSKFYTEFANGTIDKSAIAYYSLEKELFAIADFGFIGQSMRLVA